MMTLLGGGMGGNTSNPYGVKRNRYQLMREPTAVGTQYYPSNTEIARQEKQLNTPKVHAPEPTLATTTPNYTGGTGGTGGGEFGLSQAMQDMLAELEENARKGYGVDYMSRFNTLLGTEIEDARMAQADILKGLQKKKAATGGAGDLNVAEIRGGNYQNIPEYLRTPAMKAQQYGQGLISQGKRHHVENIAEWQTNEQKYKDEKLQMVAMLRGELEGDAADRLLKKYDVDTGASTSMQIAELNAKIERERQEKEDELNKRIQDRLDAIEERETIEWEDEQDALDDLIRMLRLGKLDI